MSASVSYKGNVIGTANNSTLTLETSGKYMEDDIEITDVTGGGITPTGTKQISINQNGTTIEDVTNYANAQITVNVSGGGTPSQNSHTILWEYSDGTSETETGEWDSSFVSNCIRTSTPTTYHNKTVIRASLDGTPWYEPASIPIGVELIDFNECVADSSIDGGDGSIYTQEWYYASDFTAIDPSMTFAYICGIWTQIGVYDSNKNFVRSINVYNDGTPDPNNGNLASGTLSGNKIANGMYVRLSSTGTSSEYMSLIRTA